MVSPTGASNKYPLQPALLEKHSATLRWLVTTMHWKNELAFYQKIIQEQRQLISLKAQSQELLVLENQIFSLTQEPIKDLRKRLQSHENRLAKMLESKAEWDAQYYKEHDSIMEDGGKLEKLIKNICDDYKQWIGHNPCRTT